MNVKLLTPPVIDCSGLMRSPQSDIGTLYAKLSELQDEVQLSMKDFRFFYYDAFYESYKKNLSFKKEQFFQHKEIIALSKNQLDETDLFYQQAYSLYTSIRGEFESVDYLILPVSVFEQFSLEYLLSALMIGYFFKLEHPESQLIFFGTYRTLYINDIMENFLFVDGMVLRGDKDAINHHISAYHKKKLGGPITNFVYRFEGNLVSCNQEESIDINTDLLPTYSYFDLDVHRQTDGNLVLSYELGQGCRNNCFYCYNVHKGGNFRVKDVSKIVKEIEELKIRHDTNLFHFDDNEINYSNTFLEDLTKEIQNQGAHFYWTALIIPKNLGKELLQKLYDAGCRQLRFGIESGSQRILDIIGKGTNISEIEEILKNCKEIGISTYGTFIVDLPQETITDITLTMDFIQRNRSAIDTVVICAYNTHLGTFDIRYFQHLLGKGEYEFDRTKRTSHKKTLLVHFCEKLGIPNTDVIQFMKHTIGRK